MKRKIFKVLLFLTTIALVFVASAWRQNETIETNITTQNETNNNLVISGVSDKISDMMLKPSIVNREDENLCESKKQSECDLINNKVDTAIEKMNKDMNLIDSISDKKEYFVAYKDIVNKYSYILAPPETIYEVFSEYELEMFFSVVQAEIGDEYTFEQKCNVASVILNRINHYKFSDQMFQILTPDQFETIRNGSYKNVEISEETILACEYAYTFGDTTNGALFFDSNNTLNYKFLFSDGAHNFYTLSE